MKKRDLSILDRFLDGGFANGHGEDVLEKLREVEEILFRYNQLPPLALEESQKILKDLFIRTGERFIVHRPFYCDFGNIEIGEDFISNFNLVVLDEARVTFGKNVFVGPNVSIYTVDHALVAEERNRGVMRALPVTIGDNVWIGGNTVILPGVTIGEGTVVGAGSLVTKSIPAGVVAIGSPCKAVREITDADRTGVE